MSLGTAMTYSDRVFLRAVELGCEPQIDAPRGAWLCTCVDRIHAFARYGTTAITEMSLARAERTCRGPK